MKTYFSNNVNQTEKEKIVKNPPIAKRFTLAPEAILPYLYHALEHNKPKIRYRVTKVTKLAAIAKRLLPDRLMDKILQNK